MAAGLAVLVATGWLLPHFASPFTDALDIAGADDRVIEALGQPIRYSWWPPSSMRLGNPSNIRHEIRGPHGTAELEFSANSGPEEWVFKRLSVQQNGLRVRLVPPSAQSTTQHPIASSGSSSRTAAQQGDEVRR